MKRERIYKRWGLLVGLGLGGAMAALLAGCEVESSEDQILTIQPTSATVRKNESVSFTVSGGFRYRWWLKYEHLGTLNRRDGPAVIYTAGPIPTNVVQELYVQSYIEGSKGGAPTNAPGTNVSGRVMATAYITHRP